MLAAPDVLHLLMDELTGLRRGSLPLPSVSSRAFDRRFLRHLHLLRCSQRIPEQKPRDGTNHPIENGRNIRATFHE